MLYQAITGMYAWMAQAVPTEPVPLTLVGALAVAVSALFGLVVRAWIRAENRADRCQAELTEAYKLTIPAMKASTEATEDVIRFFAELEREREITRRISQRHEAEDG